MKDYIYQNTLINKKQLKQLLGWSFSQYDAMQASSLADELKYLGFKYATQAGISISIEDLKVPKAKNEMLEKANRDIENAEKICLKGKITNVERFQKIIDTWSIASESLKENVVSYFKTYDPLNSVYIMAFSGARGNLSQVRQLVGMRGLMADPSGEIMKVPIKKNFREGLTITDYLMSGYGARKGIVDTALKTANSGYLTRRLIDIAQDIIIREKNCFTYSSFEIENVNNQQLIGRVLLTSVYEPETKKLVATANTPITQKLLTLFKERLISKFYIRSPLTCNLYHSICQMCYGWDLSNQNLVDLGEAIGILAGQSIGEPGTQLTMRTFHTGGIFTSETRQQIISPKNGIIKFSKILNSVILRTNRGEDVLLTKNSGSIIIIPEQENKNIIQIELLRNTMLFVRNNQYIKKGSIIGELISAEKQTSTERKPILSDTAGEIYIPRLKTRKHIIPQNKLLWILSGQVYQAPIASFLNYYTDHKINKNSYIFRTKIINEYSSSVSTLNEKKNLVEQKIQLLIENYSFSPNCFIQKILKPKSNKNHILSSKNFTYLINLKDSNSQNWKICKIYKPFATCFENDFKTLTGGIIYYDQRINKKVYTDINKHLVSYHLPYHIIEQNDNEIKKLQTQNYLENFEKTEYTFYQNYLEYQDSEKLKVTFKKKIIHNSIIWLNEETHKLNCDKNILLVENGNFIAKDFEIIPNIRSKTAGIIAISQKNNIIEEISIKGGFVYRGKHFEELDKTVFYQGEIIFDNININYPSLCEHIIHKSNSQLLVRPLMIYEISKNSQPTRLKSLSLISKTNYLYKTNQKIKTPNTINLISRVINIESLNLITNSTNSILNNRIIKLNNCFKNQIVNIKISENLILEHYIPAHLKYTNLQYCLIVQLNQFLDSYSVLGFFESLTVNSVEIVKFKSKQLKKKEIFLISNADCIKVKKERRKTRVTNTLMIDNVKVNQIGKIIIDNGQFLTIQKGRPYFFPNCKIEDSKEQLKLEYKIPKLNHKIFSIHNKVLLNYSDITKRSLVEEKFNLDKKPYKQIKFSKMLIKKNGKFYSSPMPLFFKNFSLFKQQQEVVNKRENNLSHFYMSKESLKSLKIKQCLPLLLNSPDLINNRYQSSTSFRKNDLMGLQFFKYFYEKSIGIHCITQDYFEQEMNNVYCKNGEFVEKGEVIGLLNFEKEITGDIVQGLPRIEELLEARKKKPTNKYVATNQKKGLLVQKTSLDSSFEFQKLGTTIKENDKINPHNLLKIYFNYYGKKKNLFNETKNKTLVISYRLTDNYEASYRTFKKIQLLILNAVQSVYDSQGVSIANKHLEVIIKQMTTKVLITHEGDTPLLPRELIDLYHIQYINQIIQTYNKRPAYYVPLLLGITKAALNNPSFISAASFQETTRVLTKAAVEGQIDWLRGLKENIIIGHLIPSGTGYQSYSYSFMKKINI